MHLEEFAEGSSPLHRLDPRVKFLTAVPYVTAVALMTGLRGPALSLAFSSLLCIIAGLDARKLFTRLVVVNAFVVLLWVFLPFSMPGEAVLVLGPLTATREGLLYVLSITLKTNAIVIATVAILGTSEAFALAHALVHMKAPNKLVHLFFLFYRYISVLHEEYTRLRRAMTVRGFAYRTSIHSYRSLGYLLGMLLVRSYERSERIYQAMLCRGFTDRFPVMSHFALGAGDIATGLVMTSVTVALVMAS